MQEDCEGVVKYILAGKCKRNIFGKVTLPSGGEVSREIRGQCLCEWFNRSHRQHLDQQAVLAYLEMLTRVALTAEEVMSLNVDTVPYVSLCGLVSPAGCR